MTRESAMTCRHGSIFCPDCDDAVDTPEPCARLVPIPGTSGTRHTNCPEPPTWTGPVYSDWFGLSYCDDHKPEGVEGA